jgi:hypothetical protein
MTAQSALSFVVGGRLGGTFEPADQVRDWRQRWDRVQAMSRLLDAPLAEVSAESVQRWRQDLHSFFIHCYHLKDALIHQQPNAVTAAAVEAAIDGSSELTLVANLANLDKHDHLTRAPRPKGNPSATTPTYGVLNARTDDGDGGWRPRLEIKDGNTTHDALTLVRGAVAAWQGILARLGIQ